MTLLSTGWRRCLRPNRKISNFISDKIQCSFIGSGGPTIGCTKVPMTTNATSLKSTPDLCDEYEDTIRVLDPIGFSNFGKRLRFAGKVVTVKCFEDNSMVKKLAKEEGANKVLVVDGGGSRRRALLGDMVAGDLVGNQWEGIVIYGCIRDVDEIGELDLGVQALGTHPMKTQKRNEGQIDIPVTIAGVTIHPGDFIACDNNGIVVNSAPMYMKS